MEEKEKNNKSTFWRNIVFSLIPLVIIFLVVEILSHAFFYYKENGFSSASVNLIKKIRIGYLVNKAEEIKNSFPSDIWEKFYGDDGQEILTEFQNQYENHFKNLKEETDKINSQLVVLYIPTPGENGEISRGKNRPFFTYLSNKYGVSFLDSTERLMQFPEEEWSLLPQNGHLSRFGNMMLADFIYEYFKNNDYRSNYSFFSRPKVLGDLTPEKDSVKEELESMVYRVYTNRQGFRNNFDLEFPKNKQRILFLGDSFTYGPYLSNDDTYPEILNRKFNKQKEFINAGIAGYTITDEASLFSEKAKYTEPDIVVLQVLDNDLYGLFYFKRNEFDRKRKSFASSELERNFIKKLKDNSK